MRSGPAGGARPGASWSRSARSAAQHLHLDAEAGAQVVGDLPQALLVAGDQDQVVAALGELDGEAVTDAGGGAGDQGTWAA